MPEIAVSSTPWRPLLIAALVGGLFLAGTVGLWAHFGTVVFYEMILAGLALCM